jgi:hypothetical protein
MVGACAWCQLPAPAESFGLVDSYLFLTTLMAFFATTVVLLWWVRLIFGLAFYGVSSLTPEVAAVALRLGCHLLLNLCWGYFGFGFVVFRALL